MKITESCHLLKKVIRECISFIPERSQNSLLQVLDDPIGQDRSDELYFKLRQSIHTAIQSGSLSRREVLQLGALLTSSGLMSCLFPRSSSAGGIMPFAFWGRGNPFQRQEVDPFFRNVSLLLKGDGVSSQQNQGFLDSSGNNLLITRSGTVTQGTFSPFSSETGKWGVYFDGSGDYLSYTNSAAMYPPQLSFLFQSGGIGTVECYAYLRSTYISNSYQFPSVLSIGDTFFSFGVKDDRKLRFYWYTGALTFVDSTVGIELNSWNHLCFVINNSRIYLYVNGQAAGDFSYAYNISWYDGSGGRNLQIGVTSGVYFPGYISNLRVIKGYAVYSGGFTPPSLAPLASSGSGSTNCYPSITNVNTAFPASACSLLICQDAAFRDNSTSPSTFVPYGDVRVVPSSPYSVAGNSESGKWSVFLDGTGDYLAYTNSLASYPPQLSFLFQNGGVGTLECYAYLHSNFASSSYQFPSILSIGDTFFSFGVKDDKKLRFYWYTGTYAFVDSTVEVELNKWNHLCFVINNSRIYFYINGQAAGDFSYTYNISWYDGSGGRNLQIGATSGVYFPGYISNLRVIKGYAVYSGSFTPPSLLPLTQSGAESVGCYPSLTNVNTSFPSSACSLLTCQDGTIKDNSVSPVTLTAYGDARVASNGPYVSYAPTKYYDPTIHGGSAYFNASGGDRRLSHPVISISGDFTIECFVYMTEIAYSNIIWSAGNGNVNTETVLSIYNNAFNFVNNYTWICLSTTVPKINTWYHVAVVRSSNTTKLFINGIVESTSTATYTIQTDFQTIGDRIASAPNLNYPFSGYISSFRINKSAVYLSNFTPPVKPVSVISNTSLLCNFTNSGIFDYARKNNLETVGNAQVGITVKKFGAGSLYFDGSGDYLTIPYSDQFDLGSGNFTIECWIYRLAVTDATYADSVMCMSSSYSSSVSFGFGITPAGKLGLGFGSPGSSTWDIRRGVDPGDPVGTSTIALNTWYHIAIVRSGSTFSAYVNGVLDQTFTSTLFVNNPKIPYYIGRWHDSYTRYWNGYIDEFRITKGVARYLANFTPPQKSFPNQ